MPRGVPESDGVGGSKSGKPEIEPRVLKCVHQLHHERTIWISIMSWADERKIGMEEK